MAHNAEQAGTIGLALIALVLGGPVLLGAIASDPLISGAAAALLPKVIGWAVLIGFGLVVAYLYGQA